MYPIKQSTTLTVPFFVHDANGDAVTGLTNGSYTKRISKNGAAFGAMTVTITEMENGWYSIPLSTSHSDTTGLLSVTFTNAGAKQVNLQWRVEANLADDLQTLLLDIPTVSEFDARTQPTADYFDPAADAVANVTLVATTTVCTDAEADIAAVKAETALILDDTDGLQVDLDTLTAGVNIATLDAAALTAIEDEIWDAAQSGHVIAGSMGIIASEIATINGIVDAILLDTDSLEADVAAVKSETADIVADTNELQSDDVPGLIAALNDISTVDVKAEVDVALSDIHLDHLLAVNYDPASKPGTSTALLNELIENNAGVSRYTAAALAQAPSGTGGDATAANQDLIIAAVITNAAGTDVAADIIAVKAETALIVQDTNELQTDWFDGGRLDLIIDAILIDTGTDGVVLSTTTQQAIADELLNRDMSIGTDSGSPTVRTVRQALRFLRNKWAISGSTLTVNKEDDSTASWTATVGTDAAADPVISSDPA